MIVTQLLQSFVSANFASFLFYEVLLYHRRGDFARERGFRPFLLQCESGGKVHFSAVFMNGELERIALDAYQAFQLNSYTLVS